MKDGTILLEGYNPQKLDPFYRELDGLIVDWTGYPYPHVAWSFGGYFFDQTLWKTADGKMHSGTRQGTECPFKAAVVLEPDPEFSLEDATRGLYASQWLAQEPWNHYGYGHLVLMAFTYKTRGFWNHLGWTPFDHVVRPVCSTAPVLVMRFCHHDPFPGEDANDEAPGDWLRARGYRRAA